MKLKNFGRIENARPLNATAILYTHGRYMMRLSGKTAIVTGGGQGIGRAICLKLAKEGARVVIADLDEPSAEKVAEEIRRTGFEALGIHVDITRVIEVKKLVEKSIAHFESVDILVNNAGWYPKWKFFLEGEEGTWDRLIAVNFRGPINCFRAVLPHMVGRNYGKILSIASDAARVGSSGDAVYAGTKAAVIAFSKSIAWEVARYGINVNCIAPGAIETDSYEEYVKENPERKERVRRAIPYRRLGKPDEIADAAAFLVSNEAGYITGQTLSVNGGLTMI
jgi:2-hydroxycyclohexanecarboxyl-CoA dehydrogenase